MDWQPRPHGRSHHTVILSQTAVYAVKAALFLARHDGPELARVDDIAGALDVPRNYLSKILHAMARAGLLESTRGPRGGFRLANAAEQVKLAEIVDLFDDVLAGSRCLLGRAECTDANPCAAHERWQATAAQVRRFFKETTLADLAQSGATTMT